VTRRDGGRIRPLGRHGATNLHGRCHSHRVKRWPLALLLLGVATTAAVVPLMPHGARSVRPVGNDLRSPSAIFDRRRSAALFIGIREFSSDAVEEVPFAVDDAVDLAYEFVFDSHVQLVPANRVILILSRRMPVKRESRTHLRELREAGADVRLRADASDVRAALREQAALAGPEGVLIVSIAAHGFLREGNAYILSASSLMREPSTMLSTAEMFETIATSRAQRSLVFFDACRNRMLKGQRTVLADSMGVAPLLKRLARARWQAVFWAAAAGESAYDDPVAQNGVFTKNVIDGLRCGAAKMRGAVTVETLAGYVERNVHDWIRDNRDPNIGSATQASIDGELRTMPLAQCWRVTVSRCPARAETAATTVRALSSSNEQLWQRDVGGVVTHAEVVDLDADGFCEVVYATKTSVGVFNGYGTLLWAVHEAMELTSVVTGDLYRQHTNEVVAIWNGERISRLVVYAADGTRLGAFDDLRHFDSVTIVRATKRHAPKIVVASSRALFAFDPKKLSSGRPLWVGRVSPRSEKIASIASADGNGDGKSDIEVTTNSGKKIFIDVAGHGLSSQSGAGFERLPLRRNR